MQPVEEQGENAPENDAGRVHSGGQGADREELTAAGDARPNRKHNRDHDEIRIRLPVNITQYYK